MSNAANVPNTSNNQKTPGNTPFSPSTKGDEKETPLWQGSFSSKAMFGTWLSNSVISVAVLIASFVIPVLGPATWLMGLGFILVLWIVTGSIFLYRRLSIQYQVTTQRLIHQRGILVRVTDRIELIDVDDISFSQGLVQRMLGVGNITISGSDKTDPVLVMLGIDQVAKVAGLIDDARRSERRKHSLHIEAV
jgi:membrane protein YdbS with pleckstrin-like domain